MKQWIMVVLVVVASRVSLAAEKETGKPPLQLVVCLADGSRLIGTTTLASLPVQSETLGKFQVPLAKIRSINFGKDNESITVLLANNDKIQANLGKATLTLRAIFGEVAMPVEKIATISVRTGSPSLEAFDPARPYGLLFDSRQNYVAVPANASFDPAEAMTLECWVKTTTRSDLAIVGKRQWGNESDRGYQLHVSGGQLHGYWAGHDLSGKLLSDGRWHHVALTWDGERRRLFQDGVKTAKDMPGVWTPGECQFRIGGIDSSNPQDFFDGAISEVRLSKRDRYQGGDFTPARHFELDQDTVGYWKLSDGSGSIVHDQSDNKHDGTLQGNPLPQWISEDPR